MTTEVERAQDAQAEQRSRERTEALKQEATKVSRKVRSLRTRLARAKAPEDADALQGALSECRSDLVSLVARALHGVTEQEVDHWYQRAEDMGCAIPVYTAARISDMLNLRLVPNAPLREALEKNPVPWETLARDVYTRLVEVEKNTDRYFGSRSVAPGKGAVWLKRKLGVLPQAEGKGCPRTLALFMEYELAEAIALAADIFPYEVGI